MCKCYKELDKRISLSETRHLNKNERIKKTLLKSILPMSKSEICDLLPDVSPDTVSVVLTSMVKKGNIKKIGKARNTKYVNADYVN